MTAVIAVCVVLAAAAVAAVALPAGTAPPRPLPASVASVAARPAPAAATLYPARALERSEGDRAIAYWAAQAWLDACPWLRWPHLRPWPEAVPFTAWLEAA
jgi:hypothetical protein